MWKKLFFFVIICQLFVILLTFTKKYVFRSFSVLEEYNPSRYKSSPGSCFIKIDALKNFAEFQENNCIGVSFFTKLETRGLQLHLKRDSDTSVSLWI